MTVIRPILLGLLALSASSVASAACTCINRPEQDMIARNNLVVQGSVVSVKSSTRLGRKVAVARIRVQTVEKGTNRRYINVEAYEYTGQCAVVFKLNEPIRLAAQRRGPVYRTNICKILPLKA